MFTVVVFLLVLSVLVLAHEGGHFLVARKSGMKVHEFGLGFPPRAAGMYKDPKTKKWVFVKGMGKSTLTETVGGEDHPNEYPSTLYSLNWLPLGGFVKIKGENGEHAKDCDSFGYQKLWKRALVLVAGVSMNVVLAAVLLSGGLMIGLPADLSGDIDPQAIVMTPASVTVEQVEKGTAADAAGLQFGDTITAIDATPVVSAAQLTSIIRKSDKTVQLDIIRAGKTQTIAATPKADSATDVHKLGVILADAGMIRFPWYIALYKGVIAAFIGLFNIYVGFYLLIKQLVLGGGMAFEVSGPVGIASMVGQSAHMGIRYLINISAMISLSLAAINILPIPALDGGRLFFIFLEKIFRRPVSLKYEQLAHTIGFLLLMTLIVVITARDIIKLF